jgi:SSS family transporter
MTPPGFSALDWAVVAVYLAAMAAIGVHFARRQGSVRAYFLADRSIPVWAAAVSIVATSVSAVTFIGAPEDAFNGNLSYLSINLAGLVAVILVAVFFIPRFYAANVTTVYELVGERMGDGARKATSAAFMLGRVMASGARLYVAAIPFALLVFGDLDPAHLVLAIAIVTVVSTLYTLVGGMKAVIWTETPQALLFVGAAAVALALLASKIPLSAGETWSALAHSKAPDGSGKLTLLDWRLHPSLPYSVWSAAGGFVLFNMAVYGADQDLAQRMLTCRSAIRGAWSAILSNFIGMGVAVLFLAIGLLLYIYYRRPDLMGDAAPAYAIDDTRTVFLSFILRETPSGLRGLMLAGVFAAAMSSLASSVAAMASTAVCDFYRPLRPGRDEAHYVRASKLAVLAWGIVLGAFACVCAWWQRSRGEGLLEFAIGVMTYAYTGLLAVFLCAIFTRRGNARTAALAVLVGAIAVVAMDWAPRLGWFDLPKISTGWRMLVGTGVAFAVCAAGRRAPAPPA